jgi:hypothetical protein
MGSSNGRTPRWSAAPKLFRRPSTIGSARFDPTRSDQTGSLNQTLVQTARIERADDNRSIER